MKEQFIMTHEQALARIAELEAALAQAENLLNTPEIHDFGKAIVLEAAHQRNRWGTSHDGGKTAADWFWLIGYLTGKALHAQLAGDANKALHHIITTAAACCNWHAAVIGKTDMRPGIETPVDNSAIDADHDRETARLNRAADAQAHNEGRR